MFEGADEDRVDEDPELVVPLEDPCEAGGVLDL